MNKSTLVAKIGDLVRERKLAPLTDVRDESTADVRIVLELKRDADPEMVMAYLFKHTPLQTNFNVNLTAWCRARTRRSARRERLDLKAMLQHFLDFRFEVVTRRLEYELDEVKKRLHILEGFEKVYDALDEMIRIIRKSDGKQDAAGKLMKRFELDDEQVDAILEMKLYKLARLEILVIQKELEEKRAEAARLAAVLKDPRKRWAVVQDELGRDARRPTATSGGPGIGGGGEEVEYTEEAFIADEDTHVVLTRDGWVKRVREVKDPTHHPAARGRRGDGRAGRVAQERTWSSSPTSARPTSTRFNDVPASTGYGDPVQKLFKFDDGERVVGALSLDPRLPRPETMLAVSRARVRASLRAGAAHRRPRPAPAAATRGRARATSWSVWSRWVTRDLAGGGHRERPGAGVAR